MFRIDDATAATSLPTPEAAGTEGYFTEGNPTAGTPATNVRGSWLNMIQEELCSILAAAGITRSKTTYNQVNSALQKMYSPVIGSARNVAMTVAAASATATLTADEIVVGSALGGQKYVLASFSKTINLATTGAGGMDTGSAPASGYVALYAISNPTTGATALLATNATSTVAPSVYGGANMPAGYAASALVSVWPTNASSQFVLGSQRDRKIAIQPYTALTLPTSSTSIGTTALSISGAVPRNACAIDGRLQMSFTTATSCAPLINLTDALGNGGQWLYASETGPSAQVGGAFAELLTPTPQTVYYNIGNSNAVSVTYYVYVTAYRF
ncbi:hypothetical protein [Paraburkholderia sp. Cpub6]|uniref:hypothetical protein n=1 Tax=Paraburkholderia sp. Cpub6 TaxID=2723094 RepID=UPI00161993EA|nr:hypothetical protein [Paraburkholderia sp. Cpub6]MBB5462865.1 hypothetical protein [Paraburkholderia sp. Cpub6]